MSLKDKIESDYHKKLKKLDEVQNDRWMHQRSMANDRSIYNRTVELLEEKNNSYDLLNKNILEQKQESQSSRKLIKKLEKLALINIIFSTEISSKVHYFD